MSTTFPSLPSFLSSLHTVQAEHHDDEAQRQALQAGGGQSPGSGTPPAQNVLSTVTMTGQEQTSWCWAAVTQSVCEWAGTTYSQSAIATNHIIHNGRTGSCLPPNGGSSNGLNCAEGNGCQADCNDSHILSVVLKENGRFASFITNGTAPSFSDLVNQINAQKPVPCRVQWSTSGGHFILVIGWTVDANGNQLVHVLDPDSSSAFQVVYEIVQDYSTFVSSYTLMGVSGSINYSYGVQ